MDVSACPYLSAHLSVCAFVARHWAQSKVGHYGYINPKIERTTDRGMVRKRRRRRRDTDGEKRKGCVPRIMIDQSKGSIQQGLALSALTSSPHTVTRSGGRAGAGHLPPPLYKHTHTQTHTLIHASRPSSTCWVLTRPPAEKTVSSEAVKILGFRQTRKRRREQSSDKQKDSVTDRLINRQMDKKTDR